MVSVSIYLGLAIVGITVAYFLWNRKRPCSLPGPKGWPLIGIFPSLSKEVFKDFAKLGRQYGDIFSCRIATADVVVANKYEVIDELFRKRLGTFNDRFIRLPETLDIPIGFGELQYGDKWKEMRSFTIGVLNNQNLGDRTFEDLLNDEVSRFYDHVKETYGSKAFSPQNALLHCMGNIILSLTFRRRIEYTDDKMKTLLSAAHNLPQCLDPTWFFATPNVFQIMARFNILPIKKFRLSQLAMYQITEECHGSIAEHERGKQMDESSARDFVDLYLAAADTKKAEGKKTFLTENSLKGVATNLFAAGLDSTATMLIWSVLLLTKYPDVQKKLREEVVAVIGRERVPTLKDKESMHYVKAVLQESHRFVTVAPMGMFHVSSEDATYNGHFIPKDTYIIANYWGIHHDDRVFPEPFTYNPERFINEAGEFVKNKYVVPYGIGKRSCPGEVLAQRELFLFLTQLVQRFELLPEEGQDPESIPEEGIYDGVGFFPPEFKTRFIPIEK